MTPTPTPAADVADRVVCLTLGHEYCPRGLSLRDGGAELLRLPVIGVLVRDAAGWTLLDAGLSPTMRDPEVAAALYRSRNPEFPGAEDPLLAALTACGLTPADVRTVAVSHLHVDHSGGLEHFAGPGGPPVAIQARELAFASTPAAAAQGYVAEDYEGRGIAWRPLDGDGSIAPSVDAVSTPGHTPGHMSYRVRTPAGTWLLAMDAIDLQEGIDLDVEIGSSARPEDAPSRRASHERLRTLAAEEGARLIPGHCPVTWPTMPGPPQGLAA